MVLNPVAQRQSIQEFEDKDSQGRRDLWMYGFSRSPILPTWGVPYRDLYLRNYYRSPYNALVQGAFAGLIKRIVSTPFEITDNRRKGTRWVDHYQDVLVSAHFGDYGGGWRGFLMRLLLDFLTLDFGGVIEVIGGGSETGALTGPVTGIAHLDSLRCIATGNPEYPIRYWSRKSNSVHKLHYTRVARLVDMPDGDERYYGLGMSALSRVISVAEQEAKMAKYMLQRLDDLPPSGLITIKGLIDQQWNDMRTAWEVERQKDGADVWASAMVLIPPDPSLDIKVDFVPFAQAPEHFNYREYTEIHVNAIALTLGVDPQDIWPLTGAPLGTGTQSQILHGKAQGKMFGDILKALERFVNFHLLPDAMEFKFKFQDAEADKERAEIAQLHTGVATQLAQLANREVALKYLADNVESFRDVLLDESGELIQVSDVDPKAEEQLQAEVTAEDDTTLVPGTEAPQPAAPAPAVAGGKSTDRLWDTTGVARKDIQAVRLDFESDFEDALKAAQSGAMDSRRFDTVSRALIRKYGQSAYEEGLKVGGVEDAPDDDDLTKIAELVAEQTSYITDLTTSIYDGDVSDTQIEGKPEMWFNKSVYPFFIEGQASADKNGMYSFEGDDGEESCETCQRLKGQVHRLRDWMRKELVPKVHGHNFVCGGFRCKHLLVKTSGRASGGY